jgi:hypothetical protein
MTVVLEDEPVSKEEDVFTRVDQTALEYSSCVDGLSLYFEVLSSPSSPELNCQCWRTG